WIYLPCYGREIALEMQNAECRMQNERPSGFHSAFCILTSALMIMFHPNGPTFRELAVQALSSTQRGYDLLAPKFDYTPFRTPQPLLDAVSIHLESLGPFDCGLDVCCGTGAGMAMLRPHCRERVVGIDFSQG